MGRPFPTLRRSAAALAVLAVLAAASCSAGPEPAVTGSSSTPAGPLTAELGQFRDNYGKQVIEIQLTNTTGGPLTVLAARLQSPLYAAGISWTAAAAGTELPPGGTKSLPARLPAASCPDPPTSGPSAVVGVRIAPAAGAPETTLTVPAADPFGVLGRNHAEQCIAQAAALVADLRLSPELALSPDARTAVLRLVITPRNDARPGGALTINSIGGTTLLAEDGSVPWPPRAADRRRRPGARGAAGHPPGTL